MSHPPAPPRLPAPRSPEKTLRLADRHRHWVFAALALAYLLGFNGRWWVEPDSALYLTLARNLAEGRGYTYHGYVEPTIYPGWPWVLAGLFRVFGTDALWPPHVLLLLLAGVVLALVYRLFLLHADRPTAVVMVAMVGLTALLHQYTFELRNELPFMAGVMATLVGFEAVARRFDPGPPPPGAALPRWWDTLLLPVGLLVAAFMRPMMLPLLGCLLLATVWMLRRRYAGPRGRVTMLAVVAAVAACATAFFLADPRRAAGLGGYEADVLGIFTHADRFRAVVHALFTRQLAQLVENTTTAAFGHQLTLVPDILATAALITLGVALARRRPLWGLWVAATVAIMLLTVVRPRYYLPIIPLLAYAWWQAAVALNRRLPLPWAEIASVFLIALWVGPNVVKVIDGVLDQRRTPFLAHYKGGRYLAVRDFARQMAEKVGPDDWVLAPDEFGRIFTYYSRRNAADPWEWFRIDPARRRLFLIQPMDAGSLARLDELRARTGLPLRPGPPLLSVPTKGRPNRPAPPWTLHALEVRAGDPPPSSDSKSPASPRPVVGSGVRTCCPLSPVRGGEG